MATTKNITMKQFNGTDYDTLYPKTIAEQVEGIYSNDEVLSNGTKALYGLTDSAVPDNVLALLSRFQSGLGNEYVWVKYQKTIIPSGTTENYQNAGIVASGTSFPITFYYSDTFHVESDKFVLDNPESVTFISSNWTDASRYNVLKGKYAIGTSTQNITMDYYPDDCTFTYSSSMVKFSKKVFYTNPINIVETIINGYVNSPDPNAYPPAVSDGYTYTPLGQLGAKVQIATGSYTGTGTYGSSNPNSLTFDKKPIAVMIYAPTQFADKTTLWPYGKTIDVAFQASSAIQMNLTWSGNTLNWYYTGNDARAQLNVSGQTYAYLYVC